MLANSGNGVVIVGGGIAGLAVARYLAGNGIGCTVVERESQLGGKVRDWACMATDQCLRCYCCYAEDLVADVLCDPAVSVLYGWELASFAATGNGARRIGLVSLKDGTRRLLAMEALVIATGFEVFDPSEKLFWGYGRLEQVFSLKDLELMLRNDNLAGFTGDAATPFQIAFFQCVGSRDSSVGANYCSQYCCKAALRMALKLAGDHPDWRITIFYVDLQVAGKFAGSLLSEAASRGIRLIQGVPGEIEAAADGMVQVVREEKGLNIREQSHRIVLSVGQRPPESASRIAEITGVPLNEFGYLAPLGVVDSSRTSVERIYLTGTCCGPRDIAQTLDQAGQTAVAIIQDLKRFGRL